MHSIRRLVLTCAVAVLAIGPVLSLAEVPVTAVTLEAPDGSPGAGILAQILGWSLAIGMAIRVKDAGSIARKWAQRAGGAAADYKDGVSSAGEDWVTNTANAGDNFAAGVNAAIADKRFERGVREAGSAKFVARAANVGAQRFTQGVQASEGDMAKGIGPVLQTIAGLTLPPRRPKGDPANLERARVVAEALRKLKTGR